MLSGFGLGVAVAIPFLTAAAEDMPLSPQVTVLRVEGPDVRRTARSLARASRAAESAGDLPSALDLARESYVKKPSRRALERVDGLATQLAVGSAGCGVR